MVRIISVLLLVAGFAAAALAQKNIQTDYPSDEERVHALQEYAQGRFKPYEDYLQTALSWHIARLHEANLDIEKISDGIKKSAQEKRVSLTPDELAEKVKSAQMLYASSGRGQQRMLVDRARELYLTLSRLCLVMSDEDRALEYRTEASKFD